MGTFLTEAPFSEGADPVIQLLEYANTQLLEYRRYDEILTKVLKDGYETNVPGLFLAGTAVQGSPVGRVRVIVENCHIHVPRIVNAIRAASRRNVPA